jgi:diguanylate cyclase (GGDEF)-like protein
VTGKATNRDGETAASPSTAPTSTASTSTAPTSTASTSTASPSTASPSTGSTSSTTQTVPSVVLITANDALGNELLAFLRANGFVAQRAATPIEIARAVANAQQSGVLVDLDAVPRAQLSTHLHRIAAVRPKTVPLFGLGGGDDLHLHLEAIRCGIEALFAKPLDPTMLADVLERRLRPVREDPYRVIVVDDSPATADFVRETLEQAGMVCRVVVDPLATLDAIRDFRPDLVLTDLYMPTCSGPELAALIRMHPGFLGIPIVYLSSEMDPDLRLEAMRQGADDFLTKPIRPEHLVASVQVRAQRTRLLRAQMLRDSLTGLYNHTTLKDRLEGEVSRAHRQRAPLCCAMLDLDHFKSVNDTHGHAVGDRVIVSLARLLRRRLRKNDVVGRYGGEEFAVLLPDTALADAQVVLDGLRETFGAIQQTGVHGPFTTSFSCGLAQLLPGEAADALNDAADHALYLAKAAGRNRVVVDPRRPAPPPSRTP